MQSLLYAHVHVLRQSPLYLLLENHYQAEQEKNETVTDVTEHHAEQEWESNCSEQRWVRLTIFCDSVSFNNLLGRPSVGVSLK